MTATPSRLQRPRRRPAHLPLPLAAQRHADPRRDREHAQPRAGRQRRPRRHDARRGLRDRRPRRRERRRRGARVTVANTAPTAGTVTIAPDAAVDQRRRRARCRTGFADVDGDDAHLPLPVAPQRHRDHRRDRPHARPRASPATATSATRSPSTSPRDDGDGGTSPVGPRQPDDHRHQLDAGRRAPSRSRPPSPRTDQTVTATPSGFREPDGQAITYTYRWLRNGTRDRGRHRSTLDLAPAGNGDRGDTIRVEVDRARPAGATSETVDGRRDRGQQRAGARARVTVKPAAPATNDIVSAAVSGFTDADGDALTYQYQWFRNGTAIGGATGRSLDLSQPGNGDLGDQIEVEVTALDGNGGTSTAARGGHDHQRRTARTRSPRSASRRPPAPSPSTRPARTDGDDRRRRRASNSGRFGRALVLRRRRRHRHRAPTTRRWPHHRHDARGVGAPGPDDGLAHGASSRRPTAAWRTRSTPTRDTDNAQRARRRSTATPASTATTRWTRTSGRTSPRPTTATSCACTSTAPRSRSQPLRGRAARRRRPADDRRQQRSGASASRA